MESRSGRGSSIARIREGLTKTARTAVEAAQNFGRVAQSAASEVKDQARAMSAFVTQGLVSAASSAATAVHGKPVSPLPPLESISIKSTSEVMNVTQLNESKNSYLAGRVRESKGSWFFSADERLTGLRSFKNDFSRGVHINGKNVIALCFSHYDLLRENLGERKGGLGKPAAPADADFAKLQALLVEHKLLDGAGRLTIPETLPAPVEASLMNVMSGQHDLFYQLIVETELGKEPWQLLCIHYSQLPQQVVSLPIAKASVESGGQMLVKEPEKEDRNFNIYKKLGDDAAHLQFTIKRLPIADSLQSGAPIGYLATSSDSSWVLEPAGVRLVCITTGNSLVKRMLLEDKVDDLDALLQAEITERNQFERSPEGKALGAMQGDVVRRIQELEQQIEEKKIELSRVQGKFTKIATNIENKKIQTNDPVVMAGFSELAGLQSELQAQLGDLAKNLNRLKNLNQFIEDFYKGWVTCKSLMENLGEYLSSRVRANDEKEHKKIVQDGEEAFAWLRTSIDGDIQALGIALSKAKEQLEESKDELMGVAQDLRAVEEKSTYHVIVQTTMNRNLDKNSAAAGVVREVPERISNLCDLLDKMDKFSCGKLTLAEFKESGLYGRWQEKNNELLAARVALRAAGMGR